MESKRKVQSTTTYNIANCNKRSVSFIKMVGEGASIHVIGLETECRGQYEQNAEREALTAGQPMVCSMWPGMCLAGSTSHSWREEEREVMGDTRQETHLLQPQAIGLRLAAVAEV